MTEVKLWLVEEVFGSDLGGPEKIRHWVVPADTPEHAFQSARERNTGEPFLFTEDELEEVVEGYMWSASDGSMIAFDVRKLI